MRSFNNKVIEDHCFVAAQKKKEVGIILRFDFMHAVTLFYVTGI